MREPIPCLLDADTVIKYYIDFRGSEIVKYLFDESPTARIYVTSVQVAEVISIFYKSCRLGAFSETERKEYIDTFLKDIKENKIIVYDYVREHLLDFKVYETITHIRPPNLKPERVYIPEFGGYVSELKDIADTGDTIMLMIMREAHLITDKKCYLFSSDGHVLRVADALGLKAFNPLGMTFNDLPQDLDKRLHKRKKTSLQVICKDCNNESVSLGSTRTIDICEGGVCIKQPSTPLAHTNRVNLVIHNFANEPIIKQLGTVTHIQDDKVSLKFDTLLASNIF